MLTLKPFALENKGYQVPDSLGVVTTIICFFTGDPVRLLLAAVQNFTRTLEIIQTIGKSDRMLFKLGRRSDFNKFFDNQFRVDNAEWALLDIGETAQKICPLAKLRLDVPADAVF